MASTKEFLLDLFAHMECADASIWTAVLGHAPAAADAQLKGYLLHLHTVQRAFLDAWTGQPVAFRQQFEDATLHGEYEGVRGYYRPARAFLSGLTEAALGERFVLPWVEYVEKALNRPAAPTTLAETVMQVISHTTHHRAQVSARLRALGGEPPMVDYIAWLWLGRPQPDWLAAGAAAT